MARKKSPKRKAGQGITRRKAVQIHDAKIARGASTLQKASRIARDVSADCPAIEDRARRDRACADLESFLSAFFPAAFPLAWTGDQLDTISLLQGIITDGGQAAVAGPRGFGKTSIFSRAAMWAVLSGRRRFVTVIAATESHAENILAGIKSELEHNALLLADFPKACHPVRKLESQSRRAIGQLWGEDRTCIEWRRKKLTMPSVPGPDNEASGAVLVVCGITGAVRGLHHVTPSGDIVRPDLVLLDDPSTRESAHSYVQNADRLAIIRGDISGLAGPNRALAMLAALTIVARDDLADQLVDRERNPEWSGRRYKAVYRWPDREDLWSEYLAIRTEGLRREDGGRAGNDYYAANRREMDRGSEVAAPQRYLPGELSAIQSAYNLRQKIGEAAFAAEHQQEPLGPQETPSALDPAAISKRCGGFPKRIAPPEAERLVAFIDPGQECCWFSVVGFDESFGASVVDYGPWPEQSTRTLLARQASPSVLDAYPRGSAEESLYAALSELVDRLLGRDWARTDGASLPLSRILIDAGWATDCVRLFCRQSPHREKLTPSKGVGIGAVRTPLGDQKPHPGEKRGEGWILGAAGADRLRLLRFDSHLWKSRVADMLNRPMGGRGGIVLYGDRPAEHELISVHLSSEYPTRVEASGRAVDEWRRYADRENHMFDCIIGSCVAASLEGLSPLASVGGGAPAKRKPERSSFAQFRDRMRARYTG